MTTLARAEVIIGGDDSPLGRALSRAEGRMQKAGVQMQRMGRTLSRSVTLPLAAVGAASVKAFSDFDGAMTQSLAIMGDVSDAMRTDMERAAKDVARTTTASATEAAESFFFLASAGLDAEQSLAALPQVAAFAQAGMFDMATATDLATDAQSALGLTVKDAGQNLKNLTRITDVLSKANQMSNATVRQFAESLTSEAGAAMKAFNIDVEEGVAVLAALADQGQKGRAAGSGFSRMLRIMSQAAAQNQSDMKRLGLQFTDSEDRLLPLADIVENLTDVFGDMGVEQRALELHAVGFTARIQQLIFPLLGAADAIREYEAGLRDADGATREIAEKQMKAFSAQMGIAKDNVVLAAIAIGQVMAPAVLGIARFVGKAAQALEGFSGTTQTVIVLVGTLAASIGPLLIVLGKLATLGPLVAGGFAVMTGPIGITVAALGLLVTAAVLVQKNWEEFKVFWQLAWGGILVVTRDAVDGVLAAIEKLQFASPAQRRQTRQLREELADHMAVALRNVQLAIGDTIEAWRDKQLAMAETEAKAEELKAQAEELQAALEQMTKDGIGGLSGGLGALNEDLGETRDLFESMAAPLRAQIIHFRDGAQAARVFSDMVAGLTAEQALQLEQLRKSVQVWRQVAERREQASELNLEMVTDFRAVPAFDALVKTAGDAGKEASFALGEELERGGRLAMQSLLEGLLMGRDQIFQSVLRIGIAIGSQLLTGGLFSVLGIGSPAKQGIYAGRMLGLGLEKGIKAAIPGVVAASFEAGQAAMSGLNFTGADLSAAIPSGSATMPQVPRLASAGTERPRSVDIFASVDAALARVGRVPDHAPPELAAHSDYWRRFASAMARDLIDRGGRFD